MSATGTVLKHTMKKERPAPVARTASRRNAAGHDLGSVDLEPTVFGLEPNRDVLHQVVTAQLAATRSGTHSTRTRAEVRGGGAKPYRQKGTGRARQGSTRAPSMNGGGIALGPKPRSYEQRTPKKMVRLALLSALSDRADIGRVSVIDDWNIEEPDTRAAVTILRKLRLNGSVLVVLAQDEIEVALSFRNIPEASITTHAELSAHDVVRADWLLFSDRTLPESPAAFDGTHEGRVDGDTARAEARAKAEAKAVADAVADAEREADEEAAAPAKKATRAKKAAKATKAAAKTAATDDGEEPEDQAEAGAPAKPRTRRTRKATAAAKAETASDDAVNDAVDDDATDAATEETDDDA